MLNTLAAWFNIWSKANAVKSPNINSANGLNPFKAKPLATPPLKLSEMEDIMKIRLSNSLNKHTDINADDIFRVKLFFKQLPTIFIRMKENGSRLLHDSKKNIDLLEKDIKEEKDYYRKLEYLFTYFIMSVVLILGIFVIRQILKKSK